MSAFYNENDPKAAAWLRELIAEGHIAPGVVDERSIADLKPDELHEFSQCHFFAGIGGWSRALRLAGWADERPVWTGSCPCQPFSAAGKGLGKKDPRHLWPEFRRLIAECGPAVAFGEQVASKAGREWLAGIRADLEALGYEVGAADLCAAGVGAPHIRQRLWWVAYASNDRCPKHGQESGQREGAGPHYSSERGGLGGLADPENSNGRAQLLPGESPFDGRALSGGSGTARGMEHAESHGREQRRAQSNGRSTTGGCGFGGVVDASLPEGERFGPQREQLHRSAAWDSFETILCADGKARRIESGTFPLAHGVSGRVGLLRGYGNAIVPEVAAQFIVASEEARTLLPL